MRLLLDTSVLLWWLAGHERLGPGAVARIADPANDVLVSAVSAWEIAIKAGIGKLSVPPNPGDWLPRELAANGFTPLPVLVEHALAVFDLPQYHADPFDRLLIAQARCEQLALLTGDARLSAYPVEVLAC